MSTHFETIAKWVFDKVLELYKQRDEIYGDAWQHVDVDVLRAVVLYKANRLYRTTSKQKLQDECFDIIVLCLMILSR